MKNSHKKITFAGIIWMLFLLTSRLYAAPVEFESVASYPLSGYLTGEKPMFVAPFKSTLYHVGAQSQGGTKYLRSVDLNTGQETSLRLALSTNEVGNMVYDADARKAYFDDGQKIVQFDPVNNTMRSLDFSDIPGPGTLSESDLLLDQERGYLYAGKGAYLLRINLSNFARKDQILITQSPLARYETIVSAAAIDTDGGYAYVSYYFKKTVSTDATLKGRLAKIRLSDFQIVAEVEILESFLGYMKPFHVFINPWLDYLYITDSNTCYVHRFSTLEYLKYVQAPGGTRSIVMDPLRGLAYIGTGGGSVTLDQIDLNQDLKSLKTISIWPASMYLEGSSRNLYVYAFGKAQIEKINIADIPTSNIGSDGGVLEWPRQERGVVQLDVGRYLLAQDTSITFSVPSSFVQNSNPNLKPTGIGFKLTSLSNIQTVKPMMITMNYLNAEIRGFDEAKLVIAALDTATNTWVAQASIRIPERNLISADINRFTTFQIMEASSSGTNTSPTVSAITGPAQVNAGTLATFSAAVSDDGLPSPSRLSVQWSKVSGPAGGTVLFESGNQVQTRVIFTAQGSYVIRLSADDGALQGANNMTVTVSGSMGAGPCAPQNLRVSP